MYIMEMVMVGVTAGSADPKLSKMNAALGIYCLASCNSYHPMSKEIKHEIYVRPHVNRHV